MHVLHDRRLAKRRRRDRSLSPYLRTLRPRNARLRILGPSSRCIRPRCHWRVILRVVRLVSEESGGYDAMDGRGAGQGDKGPGELAHEAISPTAVDERVRVGVESVSEGAGGGEVRRRCAGGGAATVLDLLGGVSRAWLRIWKDKAHKTHATGRLFESGGTEDEAIAAELERWLLRYL